MPTFKPAIGAAKVATMTAPLLRNRFARIPRAEDKTKKTGQRPLRLQTLAQVTLHLPMKDMPLPATRSLNYRMKEEVLSTYPRPARSLGGDGPHGLARETLCGRVIRQGTKQQSGSLGGLRNTMDGAHVICFVYFRLRLICCPEVFLGMSSPASSLWNFVASSYDAPLHHFGDSSALTCTLCEVISRFLHP